MNVFTTKHRFWEILRKDVLDRTFRLEFISFSNETFFWDLLFSISQNVTACKNLENLSTSFKANILPIFWENIKKLKLRKKIKSWIKMFPQNLLFSVLGHWTRTFPLQKKPVKRFLFPLIVFRLHFFQHFSLAQRLFPWYQRGKLY